MTYLDGSVLLQTRLLPDIRSICELPSQSRHRLPNAQELTKFLSFLSVLGLAEGLRYDPTVPEEHLLPSLDARQMLGLPDLKPVQTSAEREFVDDMRAAFAMAAHWVDKALDDADFSLGHQVLDNKSTAGFVSALEEMEIASDMATRTDIALDAFNRGQTGGKLLIGLAVDEHVIQRKGITAALATHDPAAVMSSMIDLFRPFLLSSWAGRHGAVFAGSPKVVDTIAAHQFALWEALEQALIKHADLKIPRYQQQQISLPMIGAVILMMAGPTARPLDVIHQAIELRRDLAIHEIAKVFWDVQLKGSTRDYTVVLEEAVDDLWSRVRSRDGPKREQLESLVNQSASVLCPAAAVAGAPTVAVLAAGGNVKEALYGLGATIIATAVCCIYQAAGRLDPPAAVFSNLVSLHQDKIHLIESQVGKIWRNSTS